MPEELDHVFAPLLGAARGVTWAEPAQVRRRGQQRRQRRRLVTGLVVLVICGLGAGTAWSLAGEGRESLGPAVPPAPGSGTTSSGPDPSASPEGSPTVDQSPDPAGTSSPGQPASAIPAAAMLQVSDVRPDYQVYDDVLGEDHGSLAMLMSYCGQTDYTNADDHVSASRRRQVGRDEQRYVLQQVRLYQPGWASRYLQDLREVLPQCEIVNIMAGPDTATLSIVASDFTGDESLLIKDVTPTADGMVTQYHAVVRRGDLETELRIHIEGISEVEARAIATAAGQRLCAATTTC